MAFIAIEKNCEKRVLNHAILKRNRTEAQVIILHDFDQMIEKEVK